MQEAIKQRIVGAVVIISLAVIVLPLVFDKDERQARRDRGSMIPPAPSNTFRPLDIPLEVPERAPVVVVIDAPEPSPPPLAPTKEPATVLPPTIADTPPVGSIETPTAKVGVERWTVQVGSFNQSDNALALRERLRKSGFTAYVERVMLADKVFYQVRVGPVLDRAKAEAHRQQLEKKMKLKGALLRHGGTPQ